MTPSAKITILAPLTFVMLMRPDRDLDAPIRLSSAMTMSFALWTIATDFKAAYTLAMTRCVHPTSWVFVQPTYVMFSARALVTIYQSSAMTASLARTTCVTMLRVVTMSRWMETVMTWMSARSIFAPGGWEGDVRTPP
jgi:hypothetical protein